MCRSTTAGAPAMLIAFANSRRNWSHWRRMSSWRLVVRASRRCRRRPAQYPSYSSRWLIRSAVASSIVWRSWVAILTVSLRTTTAFGAKWLEMLKEIAPGVTRAAVVRDAALTSGGGQLGVIQAVAPSVGVEVVPISMRDAGEIERAITGFARSPNGGLIVTG